MLRKSTITLLVVGLLAGGFFLPGVSSAAGKNLPPVNAGLYAVDPVPLQPAECGQCHTGQYGDLKNGGGKHRFACQECHQVFHAYNPRKNNYDAIMPKCDQCHAQPHGPKVTDCLTCHSNPHKPLDVPAVDRLGKACADCHSGPAETLKKYPSKHTQQSCQSCHHSRHGYIPNCFECHDGHFQGQTIDTCAGCHQEVHRPLQIRLAVNTDTKTCSGCHDAVYAKWQQTPSKHGKVNCSMCHQQHGQIPDCGICHAEPHDKRQLEMFPNCLTCHLDVHDLPVKRK